MVKHVILWTLKDELSEEEKIKVKKGIKEGLEGLKGVIPEIVDIRVITEGLSTSNADLMLDSTFQTAEDLAVYAAHPAHLEVANGKVRPFTRLRSCLDFNE